MGVTARSRKPQGFTLLEMVVVLAIIMAVIGMIYGVSRRPRESAQLSSVVLDVRGLFAQARQEALTTGRDVVVMVFPDFPTPARGTGRLIIYRDGNGDFFSNAGPVNFETYDPTGTAAGPNSEVLEVLDLEAGAFFGPATGQGAGVTLAAPFALLPVDSACTFCGGAPRRGAVVFDHAGRARFHSANGPPLAAPAGGSITVTSTTWADEVRTLAVMASTGALRTINHQLH
jgi:prepilin-type N-terminal cleavage/methylation domain-containing protein